VGLVIAHERHHLHAYYVIRNSEHLSGFTEREVELIAEVARYHRKSAPKAKHAEFAALDPEDQATVRVLAGILRIGIALDRGHSGVIEHLDCREEDGAVVVVVRSAGDASLELYTASHRVDLLESVLGVPVRIEDGDAVERPAIEIRDARPEEVPAIVALLADDVLGHDREVTGDVLAPSYAAAFAAVEADPRTRLVVAVDGDEVVGTLQLTILPGLTRRGATRGEVEGVRVATSRRSTGIGRQLLTWAADEARAQGCALLQLTTDRRRSDARRFYESLGFVASHDGMKLQL
jgi:GNAT superfamily N-acetyltransferase